MSKNLNKRKENVEETRNAIISYIEDYTIKHCYPPTILEICDGTFSTSATVSKYLRSMLKDGTLESDSENGSARAIRLPYLKVVFKTKKEIREMKSKNKN